MMGVAENWASLMSHCLSRHSFAGSAYIGVAYLALQVTQLQWGSFHCQCIVSSQVWKEDDLSCH